MNKDSKILVTGGAGYLGSHCITQLIENGYQDVISIDNFSNSSSESLQKIEKYYSQKVINHNIDLRNEREIQQFFAKHKDIETIIHFAALKDPFDSIKRSIDYYENNVLGLINLLKYSINEHLKKFIFSSTCAIYGVPQSVPVKEIDPITPQNPYSASKWMCEKIIEHAAENNNFMAISLRYFNPIGGNVDVGLNESYAKKAQNIIPQIVRVLKNKQKYLHVFGDKLPTKDGSGVRDYIHVEDLIDAYILAMEFLNKSKTHQKYDCFNIGTGIGISVFELIREFNKYLKKDIPIKIENSRIK